MMISVSFVSTSSLTWSNDIPYPITVLYPTAMTGQDNCIYVFGGLENNKSVLSESYKFNNSGGNEREWISITSMPNGVAAATGCLSNDGRIFIFGGVENWKSVTISSSIQIYNPTDDTWNTIIPTTSSSGINIEDYWMSCAVSSKTGLMYLTGGYKEGTRFYSYDVNSNTITDFYSSTTPFNLYSQGTFVTNDEKLYIFGGASGSGFTLIVYNSTYIYDISTSTLTNGNAMETAACYFGYVTDGSRFYIIGGYNENQYLQNTQVYTIVTGEWSTDNGIIYEGGIYGNAATLLNGTLHSIGGANSTDERTTGGVFISNQLKASLCGIYTFNGTCENEDRCSITNICNTKGECISNTIISCPSCKTCNSTTGECEITSQNCNSSSTSSTNSTSSTSSEDSTKITVAILIPLLILIVVIVGGAIFLINKRRKSRNRNSPTPISIQHESRGTLVMDEKMIQLRNMKILEKIGEGNFADVYQGKWNESTNVALKQLKSSEHMKEFSKEVSILHSLNHPNIVQFYGIYTGTKSEVFLVMEFMSKGSLDGVLRVEQKEIVPIDLISMTKDAICGMIYLHDQGIVHRDLALRNLLVDYRNKPGTKYVVKISDFGMARAMVKEYYKTDSKTVPVRWSSPEVLSYGTFSFKSDIWAFGVVLWEIFSYGKIPYVGMTNSEVGEKVCEGYRLPPPRNCEKEIYDWMESCWKEDPEQRPSFKKLYEPIEKKWIEMKQGPPARASLRSPSSPSSSSIYNYK